MNHYFPAGQVVSVPVAPEAFQGGLGGTRRVLSMGKRTMGARLLPPGESIYYPAGCAGSPIAPAGCASCHDPVPVVYHPAGAVAYRAAGAVPTAAPNFKSAAQRSAWWLYGPIGAASVNAMTGYEFVRALQSALGVSSDGYWGQGTTQALKNVMLTLSGSAATSGDQYTARFQDVIANLDGLLSGATTTISATTLLFAIWYTYYRNAVAFSEMLAGTSPIRLGTNAMLPAVSTPPYRSTPPRPSRLEGRVQYNENSAAPAIGGTNTGGGGGGGGGSNPVSPDGGKTPGVVNPNTPGVINPGDLASNAGSGLVAWFNRQSVYVKGGMALLGAAALFGGVWLLTTPPDDGKKKKAPYPPANPYPPIRVQSAPRPIVKVNFDGAALAGAGRR